MCRKTLNRNVNTTIQIGASAPAKERREKINWNAAAAVAAILALFVYGLQAYYMYKTMRQAQGGIEMEFYSFVSNYMYEIVKKPEIHKFYKDLANNCAPERKLTHDLIYQHMGALEVVSSLYLKDKIDGENFFDFYERDIEAAAQVLANTSEKDLYPSIIKLARIIEVRQLEE